MDSVEDAIAAAVDGELRLLDPDVRRSAESLGPLLHPDFVELGASGRRWDRESIVEQLTSAEQTSPIGVEEMLPILVAPGIVQLRYVSVNGARRSRRSSIWVHDECGWRVWFHQGTPVQEADPDATSAGPSATGDAGPEAVRLFAEASEHDAAGRESEAIEPYERALRLGLDPARRAQAQVQLASSLRSTGRGEEALDILSGMEPDDSVGEAPQAFLALALADAGREREALAISLAALSSHLPRYNRSVERYAQELVDRGAR